jgi:two-component sensor histidine kinase
MFNRLGEVLLNQALRTTAAYLRGEEERVIQRWLSALVEAAPAYGSALEYAGRWGRDNYSLLLTSLGKLTDEERDSLRGEVLDMGRQVADWHLERRFALEDILRAYSLFRLAILNEVERMLRRRLWLAFPPDILRSEDRINESLDLQMLASAQAYVRTRDEEIQRSHQALSESNKQLLRLIQEMHHRIKNNLQTVADLLSLEMLEGAKTSAEDRLRESILRVKAIATVHELLSLDNTEATDILSLAKKLVETSARAITDPTKDITFEVEGQPILLDSKRATAFVIVLNELISNAVEHGFKRRRRGKVAVRLNAQAETVTVEVRDDGVGLPPGFDVKANEPGLGLQIARTMVAKDLSGELELSSGEGTTARVRFPK